MWAGPGVGPLLAAATAWSGLAEELAESAASFAAVTSDLINGSWLGSSSAAMMAVAAQYSAWLRAAAVQAEGAAARAEAVAAAFETALTAAVQPAVVAANRGLVRVLAATNFLGQNAAAIADIEAAYEQMWAMDVAAMSAYHADASALLSRLPSWDQVLAGLNVSNLGFGNLGQGNVGAGNSGDNNVGFGNLGDGNWGFGNTGTGNVGLGNSGKGNIGFGNSGTGNIGFFNSGTGNTGILNSGALNTGMGNFGSSNLGFWNAGLGQTGWMNQTAQSINSLFGSDNVTGALSAASLNRAVLDSGNLVVGGFSPDVASAGSLGPGLASTPLAALAATPIGAVAPVAPSLPAATGVPASGVAPAAVSAPATTAIGAAAPAPVRSSGGNPAGNSGNDSGVRNTPAQENVPANGIPSSGFFDKLAAARIGSDVQEPDSSN